MLRRQLVRRRSSQTVVSSNTATMPIWIDASIIWNYQKRLDAIELLGEDLKRLLERRLHGELRSPMRPVQERSCILLGLLNELFEVGERGVPEAVELSSQLLQSGRFDAVHAPGPFGVVKH